MRLAVALSIAPEKRISTALRLSTSQSLAFRLSVFGNPFSHSVSATPLDGQILFVHMPPAKRHDRKPRHLLAKFQVDRA